MADDWDPNENCHGNQECLFISAISLSSARIGSFSLQKLNFLTFPKPFLDFYHFSIKVSSINHKILHKTNWISESWWVRVNQLVSPITSRRSLPSPSPDFIESDQITRSDPSDRFFPSLIMQPVRPKSPIRSQWSPILCVHPISVHPISCTFVIPLHPPHSAAEHTLRFANKDPHKEQSERGGGGGRAKRSHLSTTALHPPTNNTCPVPPPKGMNDSMLESGRTPNTYVWAKQWAASVKSVREPKKGKKSPNTHSYGV